MTIKITQIKILMVVLGKRMNTAEERIGNWKKDKNKTIIQMQHKETKRWKIQKGGSEAENY